MLISKPSAPKSTADVNRITVRSDRTPEADRRDDAAVHRRTAHARLRDQLVVALALVTGATDAIAFVRLGGVFTSVMTGNMVLLGMGVGRGQVALLEHTGIALAAFITGTVLGARIAGAPRSDDPVWPRRFTVALTMEFGIFLVASVGWWAAGSQPRGTVQSVLLMADALALGVQSSAVLRLNVSGLSTTYLTGTLTTLIQSLTTNRRTATDARSLSLLLALVAGAALGAVLAVHHPAAAPLVALVILPAVVLTAWRAMEWRGRL
ncbi:MAG: hypothetical protein AUG49_14505 [Catenulispora sp. 13_1_20CM_3_70_7]|nr:MAG: hypothetical protein AUG49_14505 [Catenulispora sp. 13_1_20CM_3_70_7]